MRELLRRCGELTALNGSGRAPAALTADMLRARGWSAIPDRSADAVSVPGAVAGWERRVVCRAPGSRLTLHLGESVNR